MSKELQAAISTQEEKIKEIQGGEVFVYSSDVLKEEYLKRIAKCYFEKDNKWYHAALLKIDIEEQVADVQFIGYKDVVQLHAIYIKLMAKPGKDTLINHFFFCSPLQIRKIFSLGLHARLSTPMMGNTIRASLRRSPRMATTLSNSRSTTTRKP